MRFQADFSRRVVVLPEQYRWIPSPQAGVERMMLDRVGGEHARATSIVRYAPGSSFPAHPHPGGEEILVLSGTFSEGELHHRPGAYLRNPPGSSHAPASAEGTTILVKLGQMPAGAADTVRVDSSVAAAWHAHDAGTVCPLFSGAGEEVWLQRTNAGAHLALRTAGGAELLVLAGTLTIDGEACGAGSWIRLPPADPARLVAGTQGVTVYVKTGHLSPVLGC